MSDRILDNLCQFFPKNKDFDVKIVGGAMHSLLFNNYKSSDVDLHFVPKKHNLKPYKELIECCKNMKDPFDDNNVRQTLADNYYTYTKLIDRIATTVSAPEKFSRKTHVVSGNPIVLHDVHLANSYFLIMQEITKQITIDPVDSKNVPVIFTLDAYHTFMQRDFNKFIEMTFINDYSKTAKITIDKNNIWTVSEMFNILLNTPDVYARWSGYCKWCNGAFHHPTLHSQLKLDPNRKFILSAVIEKNYQSIELDGDHFGLFFEKCDIREGLLLPVLTFHSNPNPHFGAIIDSALCTPLHLSDAYKMERLRMYYTGVPAVTKNMIRKISFDTSQAYARELLMRVLLFCDLNNFRDEKFKKIYSRIVDLSEATNPQVCTESKRIYDSIMRLQKVEKAISKKKYVCSLKRGNRSLDR